MRLAHGLAIAILVFATFSVHASPRCARSLSDLAFLGAGEIAAAQGAPDPALLVPTRALEIARADAARIVGEAKARLGEIAALESQTRGCGGRSECLTGVGRRLLEQAHTARRVMAATLRSERLAETRLREEIPTLSREWVRANLPDLRLQHVDTVDGEALVGMVSAELERLALRSRRLSFRDLFREMGAHFRNAFAALDFRELRRDGIVRADWLKSVGTVLSLQAAGHLLSMAQDFVAGNPVKGGEMLWIYGNTAAMMTLQAEVGARNQGRPDAPLEIAGFEAAALALPEILHGKEGYWFEARRKMMGFAALLPLELAVAVAAREVNTWLQKGAGALAQPATHLEIALTNLASVAVFGTYLSVRWALVDKWFNLSLLPGLRETTRRLAEEKLEAMKARGDVPAHWTLKDFARAGVEPERPWWAFWRRPRAEVRADLAENAALAMVLASDESGQLFEAVRGAGRARRIEWAWRYGLCLFDSFIVFKLFGSWIPDLYRQVEPWLLSLF